MQALPQADETIQSVYQYLHQVLFDGLLPHCDVILHPAVDHTLGFSPGPVRGGPGSRIALHEGFCAAVTASAAMQLLVHEMIHLWQFHCGNAPRHGFHNTEFLRKSIAVGLMPSSTGRPGGASTGYIVIDYVLPEGKFSTAAPRVASNWERRFPPLPASTSRPTSSSFELRPMRR